MFDQSKHNRVHLPNRSAPFMEFMHISAEVVKKILKDPSKASGFDEVHPRVLKELALELDPAFAYLFY